MPDLPPSSAQAEANLQSNGMASDDLPADLDAAAPATAQPLSGTTSGQVSPSSAPLENRGTRILGATAILALVAFTAAYFMMPVMFRYANWEVLRSAVLAMAVVVFGTLASAFYLRTGRIPFLPRLSKELAKATIPQVAPSHVPIRLSASDRNAIVSEIVGSLSRFSAGSPVQALETARQEATQPLPIASVLDAGLAKLIVRLQKEIPELSKRANLNLTFGIFFALGGMLALWWAAMHVATTFDPAKDWKPVLLAAVPRISLALVVELFSYFFLGLYRTSLAEIKYFENEITTSELRLLGLRVASESGDAEALRAVLIECARTERNFRLAKDESTVELEREKLNNSFADKVLDRVGDLVRK